MINRWSWRKNTFFCLLAGIICNQPLLFSLLSVFFPPKSDMPQRCFSFVMFSHPDLIYTCLRVVITTKDVSQNVRKKLCRKIIKFVSEFMFSYSPSTLWLPLCVISPWFLCHHIMYGKQFIRVLLFFFVEHKFSNSTSFCRSEL